VSGKVTLLKDFLQFTLHALNGIKTAQHRHRLEALKHQSRWTNRLKLRYGKAILGIKHGD
jgi:hypothetical protein